MRDKRLGILFLASVILAFLAGYFASDLFPFLPYGSGDEIFDYISETFDNYYYHTLDDDDLEDAQIAQIEAIIRTFAEANNDPYTRLDSFPLNVTPSSDESFVGIGITYIFEGLDMRVISVHKNSAADGNLYPGDLVIGVNDGTQTTLFDTLDDENDIFRLLSGSEGDDKTLVVRDADGETRDVTLTYSVIQTPTAYTLDLGLDDIAYIRITSFSAYQEDVTPGTAKVFSDILTELETDILLSDSGNKTLLIDLRDNPGGALSALHNEGRDGMLPGIVQQLMKDDIETSLFSMIPRSDDPRVFYGGLRDPKPYDIALLVNGNSASAAEVLAAVMSSYGNYPVYGSQTYGKNVYQNSVRLADIGDMRYVLVYTEGIWTYGDGLSVDTDPIPVIDVNQSGILALDLPVYMGEVALDGVSLSLSPFQAYLNDALSLSIRTDGYFDQATQDAFVQFQAMVGIEETGILDIATARAIHDHYMARVTDPLEDIQLQDVLGLLGQ